MNGVRVGLTLPSFVEDPQVPLDIARAAEDAGVDGVFVFDHLFRRAGDGTRRPALEAVALLGAVAAGTTKISVGALVLRAWLRPPPSTAAAIATASRLAPGRVIAGIGAGDSESREENDTFGLGFGSVHDRVERLRATVRATRDRGAPVWVGGHSSAVRELAALEADGWNAWGTDVGQFTEWAGSARASAQRDAFACTWGGLAVLDETEDAAQARAARLHAGVNTLVGGPESTAEAITAFAAAGAEWVILAALDPSNPRTATVLGERVIPKVSARVA
jgi:alkanesulfonate monooxygenase SsuD/methylene tetrahydromethanopterin reductase-like flavin-dependent oxidoreductase (luciferase family)